MAEENTENKIETVNLTAEQLKKLGVENFDAANYLKSEEACNVYLSDMIKTEDAELIVYAFDVVSHAKEMMKNG